MTQRTCIAITFAIACASAQGQERPLDGEAAELRRLQGNWKVSSAAFQTVGPMFYTFDSGTLTIESHTYGGKNARQLPESPPVVSSHRYRVRLNVDRAPKQIILTALNDDRGAGKQFVYIYEFRERTLWMCPDDGQSPKSRNALQHGPGGDGWLVGLAPDHRQPSYGRKLGVAVRLGEF